MADATGARARGGGQLAGDRRPARLRRRRPGHRLAGRRRIAATLVRSAVAEPAGAVLAACPHDGHSVIVVAAPRWAGAVTHWFSTTGD